MDNRNDLNESNAVFSAVLVFLAREMIATGATSEARVTAEIDRLIRFLDEKRAPVGVDLARTLRAMVRDEAR